MLLAAPAFGQTANLGLTLQISEPNAANTGFPFGGTKTFTATITNPDATLVTEITIDATLDAPLEVASVSGCTEITAGTNFPCTISVPAPGLQSGGSVSVDFDVEYPIPATLPTTCPTTATLFGATVSLTGAKTGEAAVTIPAATATDSTFLREWADLEVTAFDGPTNVGEGQVVTYTTSITNHGPCAATNVRATVSPASTLAFTGTVSAACTNGAAGFEPANRCELGTIASGASTQFSADYQVLTFPQSITHANIPVDVTAVSRSTGSTVRAIDDPDTDNNSASTSAIVDLSSNDKGCSTGGAGTLLALLPLLALRFGRRRSA